MSAAIENLMLQATTPHMREDRGGGIVTFVLIGGGAALGFVLLSSLFVALLPAVPAWAVSAICYASFIVPVYLLHRRYTFRSDAAHRQALPRYVAVQAMAMLLATLFGYVFHGSLALPSLPAAVLVVGLTSGVNYLVLRGWAFAFERRLEPALA